MIVNPKINNLVNSYHENKFSHAFLFVTNDIDRCRNDVLELIKVISCPSSYSDDCKTCNLCYQIDKGSLPNLIQIYPDGMNIKKEQILNIEEHFSAKPIYLKNNIYIINNADKLNKAAANTMLKFLEEPEDNILGFFITNNKEQMLDTIKSRCQIVLVNYGAGELLTSDENFSNIKELSQIYLKSLLIEKKDGIILNKMVFTESVLDRNELHNCLKFWMILFTDAIKQKDLNEFDFLYNIDIYKLININKIVFNTLKNVTTNVNMELLMDGFVLEVEKIL
ncbi:MAG TPA: hypothetical protein OIM63_01810 [Bacilli bacterium]|nr:hypothetical protein [Bacilli bacterium]